MRIRCEYLGFFYSGSGGSCRSLFLLLLRGGLFLINGSSYGLVGIEHCALNYVLVTSCCLRCCLSKLIIADYVSLGVIYYLLGSRLCLGSFCYGSFGSLGFGLFYRRYVDNLYISSLGFSYLVNLNLCLLSYRSLDGLFYLFSYGSFGSLCIRNGYCRYCCFGGSRGFLYYSTGNNSGAFRILMDTAGKLSLSRLLSLFCLRSSFSYGSFYLFCILYDVFDNGSFFHNSCRDNSCTLNVLVDTIGKINLFCLLSLLGGRNSRYYIFDSGNFSLLGFGNDSGAISILIDTRIEEEGCVLFCLNSFGSSFSYRSLCLLLFNYAFYLINGSRYGVKRIEHRALSYVFIVSCSLGNYLSELLVINYVHLGGIGCHLLKSRLLDRNVVDLFYVLNSFLRSFRLLGSGLGCRSIGCLFFRLNSFLCGFYLFCYGSSLCINGLGSRSLLHNSCGDNLCTLYVLGDTLGEATLLRRFCLGFFCCGSRLYRCRFGSFLCRSRLTSLSAINDLGRIFVKHNGRFLDFINGNGSCLFGSNYCSGNYGSCFYSLYLIAGDNLCGVNVLKDNGSTRTKTSFNIGGDNVVKSCAVLDEVFYFLYGNLTVLANVDSASRKVSGDNRVKLSLGAISSTGKNSFTVSILINTRIKSEFLIFLCLFAVLINRSGYCFGRIEHRTIGCVIILCEFGNSLRKFFVTDCRYDCFFGIVKNSACSFCLNRTIIIVCVNNLRSINDLLTIKDLLDELECRARCRIEFLSLCLFSALSRTLGKVLLLCTIVDRRIVCHATVYSCGLTRDIVGLGHTRVALCRVGLCLILGLSGCLAGYNSDSIFVLEDKRNTGTELVGISLCGFLGGVCRISGLAALSILTIKNRIVDFVGNERNILVRRLRLSLFCRSHSGICRLDSSYESVFGLCFCHVSSGFLLCLNKFNSFFGICKLSCFFSLCKHSFLCLSKVNCFLCISCCFSSKLCGFLSICSSRLLVICLRLLSGCNSSYCYCVISFNSHGLARDNSSAIRILINAAIENDVVNLVSIGYGLRSLGVGRLVGICIRYFILLRFLYVATLICRSSYCVIS